MKIWVIQKPKVQPMRTFKWLEKQLRVLYFKKKSQKNIWLAWKWPESRESKKTEHSENSENWEFWPLFYYVIRHQTPNPERNTLILFETEIGSCKWKILKGFLKKSSKFENMSKYCGIGIWYYYISRYQNTPPTVTNLGFIQKRTIWSLEVKNIKIFWKKYTTNSKFSRRQIFSLRFSNSETYYSLSEKNEKPR